MVSVTMSEYLVSSNRDVSVRIIVSTEMVCSQRIFIFIGTSLAYIKQNVSVVLLSIIQMALSCRERSPNKYKKNFTLKRSLSYVAVTIVTCIDIEMTKVILMTVPVPVQL